MKDMPEITFLPEVEEMAIKLAAFDIMKQLCDDGKITKSELDYIAKNVMFPLIKSNYGFIMMLYTKSVYGIWKDMRLVRET